MEGQGQIAARIISNPWEKLQELIDAGDPHAIEAFLDGLPWSERARAISRLTAEGQEKLLTTLAPKEAAELVENLPDPQAAGLIELLSPAEAAPIVEELPSNEQADLLTQIPEHSAEAILAEMDPGEAAEARSLSGHAPDSAGGLMITEYVSFPDTVSAQDVLLALRQRGEEYSHYDIQYLYVVDKDRHPVGVLGTRDLLLAPGTKQISDMMIRTLSVVPAEMPLHELAHQFEEHPLVGLPVIDREKKLVGVVQRRAVDDALHQHRESSFLASQGIVGGEEFRTHPLAVRTRRRLSWLGVNVVLNMVSASVIAANQDTLAKMLALSVFLPIISDMSGCAGQQAVAVSIRELTLGLLKPTELMRVIAKEVSVALFNGLFLGIVVGLVAWMWNGHPVLGLVVGAAQGLNIVVAAAFGGILPLVVKRLGFDPALSSGLILTTITDMCGFMMALHLAAFLLKFSW